jgi:epoxyqueuosine reductase QueG
LNIGFIYYITANNKMNRKKIITDIILQKGFSAVKVLTPAFCAETYPDIFRKAKEYFPSGKNGELSLLMCSLDYSSRCSSYYQHEKEKPDYAFLAPFAVENHYKKAALLLKSCIKSISTSLKTEIKKNETRIFSNSGLPEQYLAQACGLGFMTANKLLTNHSSGSCFIIAGLSLPVNLEPDSGGNEELLCKNCRLCFDACPGAALSAEGFEKTSCLQYYASNTQEVPETLAKNWGSLLYGCSRCMEVCPYNKKAYSGKKPETVQIKLEAVLAAGLDEDYKSSVKKLFTGTAAEMKWLPAETLLRSALLSAVKSSSPAVKSLIKKLKNHESSIVRQAAVFADGKTD